MADQIPLVDYLVLGDSPHLVVRECEQCGSRYFGRRNACAACFATEFKVVRLPDEGTLETFTIVAQAAPGIPVPFVSGVVDVDGTAVRANVVNIEPSPDKVTMGMKLRLTTFAIGQDEAGVEAISFGYEPVG
jgi:uncharacterized OB-fold protein